ncbi:hypothetical protein ACFXJ5_02885 [Streptomyces sp. NPDC059373]
MSLRAKRYLVGGWLLLVVLGAALTQWLNTSSEAADEPGRATWERCPTPSPLPTPNENGVVAYSCIVTGP